MVPTKLSVAIIGTGFGERAHLPAFKASPRCRVSVICSSRLSRARELAARYHIPDYSSDWRSVVKDATIDVVAVATPPRLQQEIAGFAMKYHKHLFLEKPLTASYAAARSLQRQARRSRSVVMVDFEFSEVPQWAAAAELLRRGALGTLRHASLSWQIETYANRKRLDSWKTRASEGGGTLNSFTSHAFYYLERFFGPAARLSAVLTRFKGAPGDADTANFLQLRMRSGLPITVSVSAHAFCGSGHRLEVYGDRGTMVLENTTGDYAKGFRLFHAKRAEGRLQEVRCDGRFFKGAADGRVPAVTSMVRRFVSAVDQDRKELPNLLSGVRVQRLIECARRSDRERREVSCL